MTIHPYTCEDISDISIKAKNVNLMAALQEESGGSQTSSRLLYLGDRIAIPRAMPSVWLKSNKKSLRETNKKDKVNALQAQIDSEREKNRQRQTGKLTESDFFMNLFPFCPAKQRPCCLLFFLIRRLAARGDATQPDYSAYSC